ncbi:glycosyltransferase [Parabacteroides johnsonii]|uniref:glycosyltransferase family 2 protein n=1 Tax=Parabacteroides johnsonii TaxID=387661 RepID=UPI0009D78CB0|nr:glycosyltransferase family 2 protein [Parabacteroides johnsonii]UEA92495.1 glycosyltransferase [Parabacteroides johnsonii]
MNQSYTNLEIIIVDDGSTDETPDLCEHIATTDNRIRVIHKQNGRQASARNAGLKVCKGEYILFLDSDDELQPNCCEIVTKQITVSPDFVLFGFNVYKNGRLLRTPNPGNAIYQNGNWEIFKKHFKYLMPSPCNKLYKKSYIKVLFDESCVYGEDSIFNYANLTEGTVLVAIEKCLYNVYLDKEDSVNKTFKEGKLRDIIKGANIRVNKLTNIFDIKNKALDEIRIEALDGILEGVYTCCNALPQKTAIKELEINLNNDRVLERKLTSTRLHLRPLNFFCQNKHFKTAYIYCRILGWTIPKARNLRNILHKWAHTGH